MLKRIIALALSALLIFGAFTLSACTGKTGEDATEAPATDAPATKTPVPTDPPATALPGGIKLNFINGTDAELAELYFSPVTDTEWGEPVEYDIPAGASVDVNLTDLSSEYDVGVVDEDGINYDIWNVEIWDGDVLTLMQGDGEMTGILRVVHADGETEAYEAEVYSSDDPEPGEKGAYPLTVLCEQTYEYDYDADPYVYYTELKLMLAHTVDQDELSAAVEESSDEMRAKAYALFDETAAAAREAYEASPETYDYNDFGVTVTAFVRRADTRVLSILYETMVRRNGYNEWTYAAYNFYTPTGDRLALGDVVTDEDELVGLINERMADRNEDGFLLDENTDYTAYWDDPDCEDYAWTLDNTGITLVFNDTAFGIDEAFLQTVCIGFDDEPGFVYDELTAHAENYTCYFPYGLTNYFRIGSKTVPVGVSYAPDPDDEYSATLFIYADEDLYSEARTDYSFEPMLMHVGGKDYIYVFTTSFDDDCKTLSIYTIDGGEVVKVSDESLFHALLSVSGEGEEEQLDYFDMITDPEGFILGCYTDLLSTVSGYRVYSADENGVPVPAMNMIYFDYMFELTALRDFTAEELIEDTPTGDFITVPAGTKLYYTATDDISEAWLMLEDGREIRLEVDGSDWPRTVDGVDIAELFDGIVFAG